MVSEVEPKRLELAGANDKLAAANTTLKQVQDKVALLNAQVKELEDQYNKVPPLPSSNTSKLRCGSYSERLEANCSQYSWLCIHPHLSSASTDNSISPCT